MSNYFPHENRILYKKRQSGFANEEPSWNQLLRCKWLKPSSIDTEFESLLRVGWIREGQGPNQLTIDVDLQFLLVQEHNVEPQHSQYLGVGFSEPVADTLKEHKYNDISFQERNIKKKIGTRCYSRFLIDTTYEAGNNLTLKLKGLRCWCSCQRMK